MNRLRHSFIAVLLLTTFGPLATAQQSRYDVEVTAVYVGFPTLGKPRTSFVGGNVYKEGSWTPVYVDVKCNRPYLAPAELVIDAADCDHMPTSYTVALPQLQPGMTETVIGYARPGSRNDNMLVRIQHNNRTISNEFAQPLSGLDPWQFVFLAIGSGLDGVPLPGVHLEETVTPNMAEVERSLRTMVTRLDQMPTQWFGYNSIDTVILMTSDRDFVTALVGERDGRKAALVDWVRRGGKLIVSIGKNQDLLAGAQELTDALPALPIGTSEQTELRLAWADLNASEEPLTQVTVAKLSPKAERSPQAILSTLRSGDTPGQPIVLRAGYGFGRVTVVAFDIDDKPLSKWRHRDVFWRELANRAGTHVSAVPIDAGMSSRRFGGYGDNSTEDTDFRALVTAMETFPGVPVISFGWVALFILAYIILVGPLDYFFLKKVVKRLELTWITFPIIVMSVSAIAYYAAYALKGSDMRINKYDLVDIDMRSKLVQGRTWFTLFSPRIQNYNIGVESAWTPDNAERDVFVGWGGQAHQSRTSLFSRHYEYLPKSAGLRNVPVQVWSTKGFQSQWLAPFDNSRKLVDADLRVPPGSQGLIGTITLNLPAALENACLIYGGGQREPSVRMLGTLAPGSPKPVTATEPRQFKNWLDDPFGKTKVAIDENAVAIRGGAEVTNAGWLPASILFNELRTGAERPSNATLRDLDQSWRLLNGNPNDAILVGTLAKIEGAAEATNADAANPTRLWFGTFPDAPGAKRPKLDGTLKQETCVRILLPVRSADAPGN